MPTPNKLVPASNYDSRWFIWTIVFLVVTGISLVSYITLSSDGASDPASPVVVHHRSP
jgi:hypothetical protein